MAITQTDLAWLIEARKYIGLHEGVGSKNNPVIIGWLNDLFKATKQAPFVQDDTTPWCGTFVAHALLVSGRFVPKMFMRAGEYRTAGLVLSRPAYGCIGVKSRKGGNHVFFIIGKTKDGRYVGIGGNQSDQVSVTTFHPEDVDTFVWPGLADGTKPGPSEIRYDLPVYENNLKLTASEA